MSIALRSAETRKACLSSAFAMTPPDDSGVVQATDVIHVCGAITISPFQNAPFMGS